MSSTQNKTIDYVNVYLSSYSLKQNQWYMFRGELFSN